MTKTVKSLRGEDIDFDKLQIKGIMADIPITDDIKKRERFVNARKRRGSRKKVAEMVNKAVEDAPDSPKELESIEPVEDQTMTDNAEEKTTRRRKVK